jgi:hypothetical protein
MFGRGAKGNVPAADAKLVAAHQDKLARMKDLQGLSRRMGPLAIQGEAERQMAAFDPALMAMGGPASIAGGRRIGGLGGAIAVDKEIEGKLQAEQFSAARAQDVIRNRMIAIATQMLGQGATKDQIAAALATQAGGDVDLRREAAQIAGGGRRFGQGTLAGVGEDISSFFLGATS